MKHYYFLEKDKKFNVPLITIRSNELIKSGTDDDLKKQKKLVSNAMTEWKDFAGWNIKYNLFSRAYQYVKTNHIAPRASLDLLDVAAGSGNDVKKYEVVGIKRVLCIDANQSQINLGIEKAKGKYKFQLGSALDPFPPQTRGISLISCNFAINHFDLDGSIEAGLNRFFHNVSNVLADNGLLIGTALDGDRTAQELSVDRMPSPLYELIPDINGNPTMYSFAVAMSEYYKNGNQSEYYVTKKALVDAAVANGLYPYSLFNYLPPIVNFEAYTVTSVNTPKFKKQITRGAYELAALNMSFTFKKVSKSVRESIVNPKGIVIIPYRRNTKEREIQKKTLLARLNGVIDVLVVEQPMIDGIKFNRGVLLNIGIVYANKKGYDYYIFHDVDLIPDDDLLGYYNTYPLNPLHLGARGQRWTPSDGPQFIYDSKDRPNFNMEELFIGGVFSINKDDIYRINGFPNNFWGWGGEDDAMRKRLIGANIIVVFPPDGSVTDLENMDIRTKLNDLKSRDEKNMTKEELMNTIHSNFTGINDFSGGIDSVVSTIESIDGVIVIKTIDKPETLVLNRVSIKLKGSAGSVTSVTSVASADEECRVKANAKHNIISTKMVSGREFITELQEFFKQKQYGMSDQKKIVTHIIACTFRGVYSTVPSFPYWNIINGELIPNKVVMITNPEPNRYPSYTQTITHAASTGQLKEFGYKYLLSPINPMLGKKIDYFFDVMKKGILVEIVNNKLNVFLPFSSYNYTNTWSHLLFPPPDFIKEPGDNNATNIVKYFQSRTPKPKFGEFVNKDPSKWYANGHLFRYMWKRINGKPEPDEGDKSVFLFLVLLVNTLYNRKIRDTIFIINPRDSPSVMADYTHPYRALWSPNNLSSIPSYADQLRGGEGIKVFSTSSGDAFADIPIPTDDDIERMLQKRYMQVKISPFDEKRHEIIFRGSATGSRIYSNLRIQMYFISEIIKKVECKKDGVVVDTIKLNIKLTSLNNRIKKDPTVPYCDEIKPGTILRDDNFKGTEGVKEVFRYQKGTLAELFKGGNNDVQIEGSERNRVSMEDQSMCKYILDIEGHTAAFRLGYLLGLGSLILRVDSEFKLWLDYGLIGVYYNEITPNTNAHYIKIKVINGEISISNFIATVNFLGANNSICKRIVANCLDFSNQYVTKDGMFDYMQKVLDS